MKNLLICLIFFTSFQLVNAEENTPENIIQHYKWCLLPKYRPNAIERMEAFYQKHHPENEQYEDATHSRYVRLSAYMLVEQYAAAKNREKMKFYLDWLKKTDPAIAE